MSRVPQKPWLPGPGGPGPSVVIHLLVAPASRCPATPLVLQEDKRLTDQSFCLLFGSKKKNLFHVAKKHHRMMGDMGWCYLASCTGMSDRQNCCALKGDAVGTVVGLFVRHLSARIWFLGFIFTRSICEMRISGSRPEISS